MYFHEIAGELKTYMSPTERGGEFIIWLVGETLRDPMTEEEEKLAENDEYNPMTPHTVREISVHTVKHSLPGP